jgi:hypothetical protein
MLDHQPNIYPKRLLRRFTPHSSCTQFQTEIFKLLARALWVGSLEWRYGVSPSNEDVNSADERKLGWDMVEMEDREEKMTRKKGMNPGCLSCPS